MPSQELIDTMLANQPPPAQAAPPPPWLARLTEAMSQQPGTVSEEESYRQMFDRDPALAGQMRMFGTSPITATPEENGRAALGMLPVTGNVIAAQDAYNSFGDLRKASKAGDVHEQRKAMAQMLMGVLGAMSPLPWGRTAGRAAEGAASRTNIFAGPMAKTADHAALAKAQEMAASGAPRDAIHAQTGWHQGVDGQWRFEIDDSGMSVKIPRNADSGSYHAYPKGIEHPDLFEAYPAMKGNRVNFDARTSDSGIMIEGNPRAIGAGNKKYDTSIGVQGRKMIGEPTIIPRHMGKVRADMAHELQHNVQMREGFDAGASPQAIFEDLMEKNPGMSPEAATEMAIDQYKRTIGEVEARNVATRLNMAAAERRAKAPWLTQDVPDEQQIVRR